MSEVMHWLGGGDHDSSAPRSSRAAADALGEERAATDEDAEEAMLRVMTALGARRSPAVAPGGEAASVASATAPAAPVSARLAGTGPALDLRREEWEARARLRFVPAASVPASAPRAVKTLRGAVRKLEETAPDGDGRLAQVVRAVLPYNGGGTDAGTIPVPPLTLEQYASLRAELSAGAEAPEAVWRRYRVLHAAALRALGLQWEARFVAQPELRVLFERKLGDFTAWVWTRPQ